MCVSDLYRPLGYERVYPPLSKQSGRYTLLYPRGRYIDNDLHFISPFCWSDINTAGLMGLYVNELIDRGQTLSISQAVLLYGLYNVLIENRKVILSDQLSMYVTIIISRSRTIYFIHY